MISLLRTYEENGEKVEEYTRDGQVVSHIVQKQIIDKSELQADEKITPAPTIEEKILYETQYQTMLIETSMSF